MGVKQRRKVPQGDSDPCDAAVGGEHRETTSSTAPPAKLLALPWVVAAMLLAGAALWEAEDPVPDFAEGVKYLSDTRYTVGPRGVYPKGCTWRESHDEQEQSAGEGNSGKLLAIMYNHSMELEYLHPDGNWSKEVPQSCTISTRKGRFGTWSWASSSGPRSDVDCQALYCTYKNLWYNRGQFYTLVDGPIPGGSFQITKRVRVHSMHVRRPKKWLKSVRWAVMPGETVVLDYLHPSHPTAIGHWPEMLSPLYSVLRAGKSHFGKRFKQTPDQFVLLRLQRKHFMEWVRGQLAVTLGIDAHRQLPPVFIQETSAKIKEMGLTGPVLEGSDPDLWLCFTRALVIKDHIKGGGSRLFSATQHARDFRAAMYKRHGLPPPQSVNEDLTPVNASAAPRQITFLHKSANRRILNEEEFFKMLQSLTCGKGQCIPEITVVEFDSKTSLKQQLEVMAKTGLLISAHASQMANAQFLHPGAAVLELIHRNWLGPYDKTFREQTGAMGDIHHFAWRCTSRDCAGYIDEHFGELYSNFTTADCGASTGCMDKHTNTDILVDVEAVRALLQPRLQRLWGSGSYPTVKELEAPWPKA